MRLTQVAAEVGKDLTALDAAEMTTDAEMKVPLEFVSADAILMN